MSFVQHDILTLSDMPADELEALAQTVLRAYKRVNRYAPAIEVGTRAGGSALLILRILNEIFEGPPPPLLTVDPYGNVPYDGGDQPIARDDTGLYGDAFYTRMKAALAPFPNHVHFMMLSDEFFDAYRTIWRLGREIALDHNCAFVHLDGAHSAHQIERDLQNAARLIDPDGIILIQDIDKDSATRPRLRYRGIDIDDAARFVAIDASVVSRL